MDIYVGNLPYKTNEQTLRDTFEVYGQVASATVITDRFTGDSKGFAFVTMDDSEEAKNAIKELDGTEMDGRTLKVNEARPREERPRKDFSRRNDHQDRRY